MSGAATSTLTLGRRVSDRPTPIVTDRPPTMPPLTSLGTGVKK